MLPKKPNILVVDDHSDTAECMGRLLRLSGYDVRTAGGYREAIAAGQEDHFDLLLCDIGLPDGDGCRLLEELRARYPLPAIAVTGHVFLADRERTFDAGFAAHVCKPVNFNVLLKLIEQVMESSHAAANV
jgi:CheY-like chemotaxis protein